MAINSQRKNMSNFKTWTQENLAEFAYQANIKMIQQNERIEELQRDFKDVLEAYRALNLRNVNHLAPKLYAPITEVVDKFRPK